MPPLSGQPSYITEPKTWDVDLLAYVALEVLATDAAPGYDSGLVTLPDALTVLTALTVRVLGILLCNLTANAQVVTVTDTAGNKRLNAYPLQGNSTVFVDLGGVSLVGVKWQAGAAASVNAQLVGNI